MKTRRLMMLLAVLTATALMQAAEKLNRSLVAFNTNDNTTFVSWRFFDGEQDYVYRLYRNGEKLVETRRTSHTLPIESKPTDRYKLEVLSGGSVVETTPEVTPYNQRMQITLQKPDASVNNNSSSYSPNDISIGDVDGDGEMELFVKWDPADSQDNSKSGKTSNVVIDCYKMDGTRLWSVNLGPNIRAGAHYTQFLVYDFDGDGRAEMICKTAPWSKDGQGRFVSEAADDTTIKGCNNSQSYRNGSGQIKSGPEFLTVFNGQTGAAVHTIWYNPNRAGEFNKESNYPSDKNFWGDDYANRSERYNACVAHLDGEGSNPTAIFNRGYYTRAYFWAVDFNGSKLVHRWLHASVSNTKVELYDSSWNKTEQTYSSNTCGKGSHFTAYGNGNHNLSAGDYDGDGCDEITFGSAAIDNDGSLMYAVGFGHGDAIHVGKMIPDRDGLQVFHVHEEKISGNEYGWDLHDAGTGEVLYSAPGAEDNGRGIAGDFIASNRGYEFASSNDRDLRAATTGQVVTTKHASVNFRIYWDGSLQDNLADGGYSEAYTVTRWNGSSFETVAGLEGQSCNTTKRTPNLQCDLLGDWREEIILHDGDHTLYIYSSDKPTNYKVPCLLTDHIYRLGIAWQMSSYNQPPHLGYYLPEAPTTIDVSADDNETLFYDPNELANDGVQHNEVGSGDIKWNLGITDLNTLESENADAISRAFSDSKVTVGNTLAINGTQVFDDIPQTKFNPTGEKEGNASDGNAINFMTTLKDGYEFQPTDISFYTTRYGTDGGNVDVTWVNGDASTKSVAKAITPERNNATPPYTKAEFNLNGYKSTTGTFGVRFNLYGVTNNKQLGLGGIVINGKLYSTSPDGIRTLQGDVTLGGRYFNLQGTQVSRPTKGVYIHGGRKVVVK